MLISVLVRSSNDETQIAGSLAAIFSQRTEDQVEVIVCDDDSTDGTRGILAGLGGRIRLLHLPAGPLAQAAAKVHFHDFTSPCVRSSARAKSPG